MTRIIAAVRSNPELIKAAKSSVDIVFLLSPNISDIASQTELIHRAGKKIFIHIDLAEGIGRDEAGIRYVKTLGVDGIISTRTNMIKIAGREGMHTVQRFFAVDSQSVNTIRDSARSSGADMIEIMPGIVPKIIKALKRELDMPIVAGGLIETITEAEEAIKAGAGAISTGNPDLWRLHN